MAVWKTPGVYIQEVTTPGTLSSVTTSVAAFIGGTQKDDSDGTPALINSFADYERLFGTCTPQRSVEIIVADPNKNPVEIKFTAGKTALLRSFLYYSVQHFFQNGGSRCYIVSAGSDAQPPGKEALLTALAKLQSVKGANLVAIPDAVLLSTDDCYEVYNALLAQCGALQDRFAVIDVKINADKTDEVTIFRDKISGNASLLRFGAAYYPYLHSSLAFNFADEDEIFVQSSGVSLTTLSQTDPTLYQQLKLALGNQLVSLPPSGAVLGVYAAVDDSRGVWKAPANVSLNNVLSPTITISNADHEALNVHISGKSVNAIRAFTGKGTLIWGARTLSGNDNDWRYVSVRRFFIMVEQSIKQFGASLVFEPNDANTWAIIKAQIENYLIKLWRDGALMGAKPSESFFVHVGLGVSMTAQDSVEGRMIADIGMAAVRPAEFILIKIIFNMQQSNPSGVGNAGAFPAVLLLPGKKLSELKMDTGQMDQLLSIKNQLLPVSGVGRLRSATEKKVAALPVLFQGAAGAGKTQAAAALGKELGAEVYRVDLSAVRSKYIGETEKNLSRIFDAAADKGAILFFDEADALFGKRTTVKDSHDRYANIEINYLLQKMEEHKGLSIISTQNSSEIDPDLLKRFRAVVPFKKPK